MDVDVKIGGHYIPCTLTGRGVCKLCGDLIVWARKPNGKFTPLEPEEGPKGVMESHFPYCVPHRGANHQHSHSDPGHPPGIEMTETLWRQLLRLVHPDKHRGGEDERLANDLTRWLLEQRPRLSKEARGK
jgi:hypothetical protein